MPHAMAIAFRASLWAWLVLEVLLQVRQLLRSGRTVRTEWRTLAALNVLTVAALFLTRPVGRLLPALDYPLGGVPVLAAVLAAAWAGILFRLWAIRTLGRFFRATVHVQEDHRVVDRGPYRWVRHPSYTGLLLGAAAMAFPLGNAAAWLLVTVCFAAGLRYRIAVEERVLLTALGDAYARYADGRRRLVPGVW